MVGDAASDLSTTTNIFYDLEFDLCRPHSGLTNTSARPVWIALEKGQDLGSSAARVQWIEEDADVGRRDLHLGWTRRQFV